MSDSENDSTELFRCEYEGVRFDLFRDGTALVDYADGNGQDQGVVLAEPLVSAIREALLNIELDGEPVSWSQ